MGRQRHRLCIIITLDYFGVRHASRYELTYISACRHASKTIPTARHMFSWTGSSIRLNKVTYFVSGGRISKIATAKTKIHICHIVHMIERRSDGNAHVFGEGQLNEVEKHQVPCEWKYIIQDGGRQTHKKTKRILSI